jgi:RNA polymerase sigma factor (sigma-70 family)
VWQARTRRSWLASPRGIPRRRRCSSGGSSWRVYGLALTIVRDAAAAEDVAQEAFVRAWRRAETYDPRRGRVLTWLLAIARNAAIDAVRLRRAEPVDPRVLSSLLEVRAARGGTHDDAPREESDRLREALMTLAPEQRRALLLAAYLGHTAREIGEIEGVPLGTAKTRIRTALLRLRGELEVPDER